MGHELFLNYINASQGQVERSVNFREFQKRPPHLTFSSKMPLVKGVSKGKVRWGGVFFDFLFLGKYILLDLIANDSPPLKVE